MLFATSVSSVVTVSMFLNSMVCSNRWLYLDCMMRASWKMLVMTASCEGGEGGGPKGGKGGGGGVDVLSPIPEGPIAFSCILHWGA